MKNKWFLKVIILAISLAAISALVFLPMAQAQTINCDADHDFDPEIPGNYQYMEIKLLPNSYFEIELEV
ncbi:MAG: hypothetical protein ACMUIM_12465, partial [bacterium]